MQKEIIYILLVSIFMNSCASVMNQSTTKIDIYTTSPSTIIYRSDTLKTDGKNKVTITIERKNVPIQLTAKNDSLEKNVEVSPINSVAYYLNIPFNYGFGMLIDRKNPKRNSYPRRVYLNSSDTIPKYYRYSQGNQKGEFYLHLSLPHINHFSLQPENESDGKINTGFWGISLGLDYHHSRGQFLNLSGSAVSDFFVPVPAAVDISGEYELMSSIYLSLSNNHKVKRFSLGYGISYGKNVWDLRYSDRFDPPPPTREPIKKSNQAIGFVFPSYYQLGERFNIGLIYRPTFLRLDMEPTLKYEHLISIDFAWKIKLK